MPRKTTEKLREEAGRASRMSQTLNTPGWIDIILIIQNKYNDCMNTLLSGENAEARGGIKALTEIMDDISTELQFGENARKKYTETYLNIKRPTGE